MKALVLVIGLVVFLAGNAEASMLSKALDKTWGYLWSPVNCVWVLGQDVVAAGAKFVTCVVNNANPKNLIP